MSSSNRNILISCLVLLVVACLCAGLLGVGGAGVGIYSRLSSSQTPLVTQTTAAPTFALERTSTSPAALPTLATAQTSPIAPTASPPSSLPVSIARQMDQIQGQVVQLRGLQPTGPVHRELLTHDQLRQKVSTDFFKTYTPQDAKNDALILTAFGLLPSDFDLYSFYQKLYTEEIAGYYDNQTKAMYVIADNGFLGPERMTYAHEYTHVLQDQNFDIQNGMGYSDEKCKTETELCAGIQALIEGDATLIEQEWMLKDSTPQDKAQIQQAARDTSSPVFDSAPAFMQQDFVFPYQAGLEFVQSLVDRGGWTAVNAAFRDPPRSTSQILHPDRYPQDKPVQVALPDLSAALGSGWRRVNQTSMGEWYTYLILAYGDDPRARLSSQQAQSATSTWAGDTFAVYASDAAHQTAATLISDWGSSTGAGRFRSAFEGYGNARWGNPVQNQPDLLRWQSAAGLNELWVSGPGTTWISAPTLTIAQAVETALQLK